MAPAAAGASEALAAGSGKTAAFALPILERLLFRDRRVAATYALVLTPTRELAVQVGLSPAAGPQPLVPGPAATRPVTVACAAAWACRGSEAASGPERHPATSGAGTRRPGKGLRRPTSGAAQVHSMIQRLAQHTDVRLALAVGGLSLQSQATALRARPEIVVATPVGRALLQQQCDMSSVGFSLGSDAARACQARLTHHHSRPGGPPLPPQPQQGCHSSRALKSGRRLVPHAAPPFAPLPQPLCCLLSHSPQPPVPPHVCACAQPNSQGQSNSASPPPHLWFQGPGAHPQVTRDQQLSASAGADTYHLWLALRPWASQCLEVHARTLEPEAWTG